MATQDPTTNYAWNLPNSGGDAGAWGDMLNAILGDDTTGIDAVLKAVSTVANAAMPKAGGTFTGEIAVKTDKYDIADAGSMLTSEVLDLSVARFFHGTLTGATTISFSNVPAAGKAVFVIFEITNGGAYTITWPSGTKWPGGAAPTLQATGVDIISMYTRDGGATWRAALAQGNSA